MIELAYTSTARWLYSPADIEAILEVSRANNGRHGITGLLLYRSGSILQLLEGPPDAVRHLYGKLLNDLRHSDLTLLYDRPLPHRHFSRWSMAFHDASPVFAARDGVHQLVHATLVPAIPLEGRPRRLIDSFLSYVR